MSGQQLDRHAWCRDIPRDEAVRAAEDGRSGPLPTLESVIAEPFAEPAKCSPAVSESGEGQSGLLTERVTERRPPEPGGGENVTGGMRTERVTLEITREAWRRATPTLPDNWAFAAREAGITFLPGESVRVVDHGNDWKAACESARIASDTIADLTRERDAAIRERDELRSQVQILDEGQPTAPSDLGVWCTAKDLSARCKELAARLVTTAVRASSAETALREIFAQDYARSSVNGASWKMHDIAEKALKSAPAASGVAVGTCNTFCGVAECERADPGQCRRGAPQAASGAAGTEAAG